METCTMVIYRKFNVKGHFVIWILVLYNNGPIIPEQQSSWTMQLATGLAFIHEKNIAHRNIKPSKYFSVMFFIQD